MASRVNALRELQEAEERREDEELELLEALEEEEASWGKVEGRGKRREKPLWRTRAEKRRAERLEEERLRDRELLRRRKAALARAKAKSSGRRRSDDGEEDEGEGTTEDDGNLDDLSPLLLLESEKPKRVSAADLLPRGLPPQSFHPLNPGVDFAAAFRWGLRGTFEEFTPLGAFDWLLHFVNGGVRPAGRRVRRALAFVARGGGGYFRPF